MLHKFIGYCLNNRLVVILVSVMLFSWGVMVAPFDWDIPGLPRSPVPVDAIPDIGENQQIVFTEWKGRSPRDVEDQITYPLTSALMGVPGVKNIRSYSMFGFSSIYVIFEEDIEFYWSRSRILEKLNSLPRNLLPNDVQPSLGPDATALGQVFWYTLEGRDESGNPAGGWDLNELRSVQDWYVRYNLMSVSGVAEVASVGGFVKEYQIDVNPDAMFIHEISLQDIFTAVKKSNIDVGARTMEINKVEYVIRGLGLIGDLEDIEQTVVKVTDNVPIKIKDVANVQIGPASRRGALDKEGAEAVGGVVVVRYGENPLAAIQKVKEKILEISSGLPKKVLPDGSISQVTIVPFYDRSELIHETLDTLKNALTDEILITIIVVILMVMHLKSAMLISGLLPLTVLWTFIAMKLFHIDANIVALSGIAIAIGTIVDMGIIVTENILKHREKQNGKSIIKVIQNATSEVSGAVMTAISTTVISFLPVFTMTASEGKLFKPLAYTKTFALISSVFIALIILPVFASILFNLKISGDTLKKGLYGLVSIAGMYTLIYISSISGVLILLVGLIYLFKSRLPEILQKNTRNIVNGLFVSLVLFQLTNHWHPLGPDRFLLTNLAFVALLVGGFIGFFKYFQNQYTRILKWCLENRLKFLSFPMILVVFGFTVWLGLPKLVGWLPAPILKTKPMVWLMHSFPGMGKEFMPPLNEGSFLYMPTTMPHASIGEALDVLQKIDMAINSIPEVESVVGKIGRVDSSLDPAPVSMIETVVNIIPEYIWDEGKRIRQWRDHIKTMDDIWQEIVNVAQIPGTTSAPKLMPIITRIVMLQSGMRAPMGIKVKGPDLETIDEFGLELEAILKNAPGIKQGSVFADRIMGKPYLEIEINREAIARYGLHIQDVQDHIEVAIGGKPLTWIIEGRERYPVRVRYARELRDSFEDLENILISAPTGQQIPLIQLAEITYVRGPQMIKSEDSFPVGYVLFDKLDGYTEVDVVQSTQSLLKKLIMEKELEIPTGVSYKFAGSYVNQIRAAKTLAVILPLALFLIVLILHFQFKRMIITLFVFSGIIVAWSGGFILIWFYNQPWFLDFFNLREIFNITSINLSVAVWVGFLALFGIASDNGVLMATYLQQRFRLVKPNDIASIRKATIEAGNRRVRPALMTVATTILALLPVLTSSGRGSDIMIPMAIPTFGGMLVVIVSIFIVPTLYSWVEESKLKIKQRRN